MEIASFFHLVLNSLDMIGHFLMTPILSENVATYLSLQALTLQPDCQNSHQNKNLRNPIAGLKKCYNSDPQNMWHPVTRSNIKIQILFIVQ